MQGFVNTLPRMKDSLRQQFERLGLRLAELDETLSDPAVAADMKRYRDLAREHAEVAGLVDRYRRFEQREADLAGAREMLADPDMATMAQEEVDAASADCDRGAPANGTNTSLFVCPCCTTCCVSVANAVCQT